MSILPDPIARHVERCARQPVARDAVSNKKQRNGLQRIGPQRIGLQRVGPGWLVFAAALTLISSTVLADQVTFRVEETKSPSGKDGKKKSVTKKRTVEGEVLVEAADGGVMLLADDGRIWTVQPDQLIERLPKPPPQPIDHDKMTRRLMAEYPGAFETFKTNNYLILYQGNEPYARHVAALFESLHRAFFMYWQNQNVELEEPKYPLVALILADHDAFIRHATKEIGDTASQVIGYYHLESNRMTTFRVPNLERNIATLIHEATHQLSYNCGLQTRFADNPMWVSEGMATFFEAPDFSNPRGWRGVGRVNQVNLLRWNRYLGTRPSDSLVTLIADDSRFRSAATAEAAYAEAWALTYFLLKTKRDEFVDYLEGLADGEPLKSKTARQRIEELEAALGCSIAELDQQLVAFMRRVR